MDKSKRKSLIISYLKNSINLEDYWKEIGTDIEAWSDPLLSAISSDLSYRRDAALMKAEIFAFDKEQEEGLTSPGIDYIENQKRVLTLQARRYISLLSDKEVREIFDKWGTSAEMAPAEDFKNGSFTNLLKFLQMHPEYDSEIQEILVEIETETGLSEELQDFSDTVNNKVEEKNKQDAKREELSTFLDETVHTFDTLLQLDEIDEDTRETIRNAAMQSYKIYEDKYSELIAQLDNDTKVFENLLDPRTLERKKELMPGFQRKLNQIENMIEQLEEKYGNFTQDIDGKEQEKQQEESIKDEVGDEFKPKTPEQQKDEEQAELIWTHRLQVKVDEADKLQDGAPRKREVVQLIQDLDRDIQKSNQQEQTNSNNEQRRVKNERSI